MKRYLKSRSLCLSCMRPLPGSLRIVTRPLTLVMTLGIITLLRSANDPLELIGFAPIIDFNCAPVSISHIGLYERQSGSRPRIVPKPQDIAAST